MFRNILNGVEGVTDLPIFVMIVFFLIFTGSIVFAYSSRKDYIKRMSTLPMDDGTVANKELKNNNINI